MEESKNKLKNELEQVKAQNNYLININKKLNDELNILKSRLEEEQNLKNYLLQLNEKLNEKINNLDYKLNNKINNQLVQNDSGDKEQLKLYKKIMDLNEKLKRYPYNLEKNEKLISVIFASVDQKTHYSLICKNTHSINNIEAVLYKEYPDYCNSENYFLCKGKIINKFQTLENNHIKNGDVIIINKMNSY